MVFSVGVIAGIIAIISLHVFKRTRWYRGDAHQSDSGRMAYDFIVALTFGLPAFLLLQVLFSVG